MKKQLVAVGIATAVGVTGMAGIGVANAATTPAANSSMSSLVDELASKFNLNKTDVQAVFDNHRTEMQTQREAEIAKEVAQLVTDGKLTQAQADKINAKRAELQKERDSLMSSDSTQTRDQMRSAVSAKRTELETWAKDNGIDAQYLRYVLGGRGHGFHGHGMMHGVDDASAAQ